MRAPENKGDGDGEEMIEGRKEAKGCFKSHKDGF